MRNTTVDATESFPYLPFFPSVRSVIEEQLPSRDQVRSIFEEAGFHLTAHEIVRHQKAADWTRFAEKISGRSDSFLARIPDAEFEAGVAALRDYAGSVDLARPVVQDIDFFVFQR